MTVLEGVAHRLSACFVCWRPWLPSPLLPKKRKKKRKGKKKKKRILGEELRRLLWRQCFFLYSLSPSLDGGGSLCLCIGTPGMGPQGFPIISITFLSVFKEKPKYPPSRAQSLSYALATTDASYFSSIVRLFKNLNFVLLVITYGKAYQGPGLA